MHRTALTAWLLVAFACASSSQRNGSPVDVVKLSGLAFPQYAAGLEARSVSSLGDPPHDVAFTYARPAARASGATILVPIAFDSVGGTSLHEVLEAEVAAFLGGPFGRGQPEVSAVQPIEIVGTDGVTYRGSWATLRAIGDFFEWRFAFQKQGRVVKYYVHDNGLNPWVTLPFAREFISATLGEFTVDLPASF
jgi:hypothetical protein